MVQGVPEMELRVQHTCTQSTISDIGVFLQNQNPTAPKSKSRKSKYATVEEKIEAHKASKAHHQAARIFIGKALERWERVRLSEGLDRHEDLANHLIDVYDRMKR